MNVLLVECPNAVRKQVLPLLVEAGYSVSVGVSDAALPEGPCIVALGPCENLADRISAFARLERADVVILCLVPRSEGAVLSLFEAGADDVVQVPLSDSDISEHFAIAEARLLAAHNPQAVVPVDADTRLQSVLLDQVRAAVILTDLDGTVRYWNRFATELYGWATDEAVGRPIYELTTPQQSRDEAEAILAELTAGRNWEGEFLVRNRDGRLFTAQVVDAPFFDESGELSGIIGMSVDISGMKDVQLELARANTFLEQIMQASSNAIVVIDSAGIVTMGNRRLAELTGYDLDELVGTNLRQLLPVEAQDEFSQGVAAVFASAEPLLDVVVDYLRKDGEGRVAKFSLRPVTIEGRDMIVGTGEDVTDRLVAEREVQRLGLVYEYMHDAVIVSDLGRRIVDLNPAAEAMTGYTRDEAIGMPTSRLLRGEDAEAIASAAQETITREGRWQGEAVYVRRDGSTGHCETVTAPLRDRAGAVVGRVAVHRDISERRAASEALRLADEFRRLVMDSVTEGIFALDTEGCFTLVNDRGCEIAGTSRQELLGSNFEDLISTESAGRFRELLAHALQDGGSAMRYRADVIRRDGVAVPVDFTIVPLITEGRFAGVVGTADNISARSQAELDLRESEERFRALVDAAYEGVIILEAGVIREANTASALLFGRRLEDLLGQGARGLVDDDVLESFVEAVQRSSPAAFETTGVRSDGSTFPMGVLARESRYRGRRARVLAVRDLTDERRAAEAEIHQQKLQSLSVLAGGIAHDFNNILVAILANASLAREQIGPGSLVAGALAEIELAARRASDLSNQMLLFAGDAGTVTDHVSLNDVVNAALESVGPARNSVEVQLSTDPVNVSGDAGQLRQAVANLLVNAIEAVADGGSMVRISTSIRHGSQPLLPSEFHAGVALEARGYAAVTVEDDGPGLEPGIRERMFDPFFSTRFAGRGLGLASVLGTVAAHAGAVLVDTIPEEGTSVTLLIPLAGASPSPVATDDSADWRASGTILVVDDDDAVRAVTRRALEMMGFSVLLAADGEEGVDRFREHSDRITIVLLDLTMPGMGGEQAGAEIRRISSTVPIVIMSGFSQQDASERFHLSEPTDFLQKPYMVEDLRNLLKRFAPGD